MPAAYDVIVIGGGPGGATVSTILADSGKRVLLLERERFPRYHIGESLLSGTTDLLKRLGVVETMDRAEYVKKYGVTWVWGAQRDPWTVYFKDALATPYDFGYQVERASFDKMLLDNAREHGVEVMEEHAVIDILQQDDRVVGVTYQTPAGQSHSVQASWTVDASGQGNFITRRLSRKEWDAKLRNMAVWSYWKHAQRPEGLDSGNTFLPTFADGWWWFIPLRENITSIGVVLDRDKYGDAKDYGLKAFYASALDRTPELKRRLSGATMCEDVRVTMDWSYSYDAFFGPGYTAVGDAACFIDPLLSTGVHLAILSGYLCAIALNTVLCNNDHDEHAVLQFYQDLYSREFNRLKDQIYFLYGGHRSPDSYFWHARKTMDMPGANPQQAFTSLIAGAFEHRSWYSRFMERLDVPDSIRTIADALFAGTATGTHLVTPHTPLIQNPQWHKRRSFAIKNEMFHPADVLAAEDGRTLALTEPLAVALDHIDGTTGLSQILSAIAKTEGNDARLERVRSAVNEAITYGAITPIVGRS